MENRTNESAPAEEILHQHARLQRHARLLDAVARISEKLLTSQDVLSGLDAVVNQLAMVTEADRVCINRFEWTPNDPLILGWQEVVSEWTRPGAIRQADTDLRRFSMPRHMIKLVDALLAGQTLWVMDEMEEPFRSEQKSLGVIWNVSVPIQIGREIWGVIGFDHGSPVSAFDKADVSALETAAAVIASAIQRQRSEEQRLQAEKAVSVERDKAAQAQIAELAKVNGALQKGIERLAVAECIDSVLEWVLLEAVAVTGAAAGSIGDRHGTVGTAYTPRCICEEGRISKVPDDITREICVQRLSEDSAGYMKRVSAGEVVDMLVDDRLSEWFPEAAAYHRSRGHRLIRYFPFQVRGQVTGFLSIATKEERPLANVLSETVCALVNQASLALQTLRLADQAKEAAVLSERERLAQERAAELSQINESLLYRDALLTAAAEASRMLLDASDLKTVLPSAFGIIGTAAKMDRLLLIVEASAADGQLVHRVLAEWTAPGISTHAEVGLTDQSNQDFPELIDQLHRGRSFWIHIDDVHDRGAENFRKLGIITTTGYPIFVAGEYVGLLAFDDCRNRRPFTSYESDALRAAAAVVGAALHRSRLIDAIARQREQSSRERVSELSKVNETLQNTIKALGVIRDLNEFVPAVLQIVQRAFQPNASGLYEVVNDRIYLRYWALPDRILRPAELLEQDPVKFALILELAGGFTIPSDYLYGVPEPQHFKPCVIDHSKGTSVPEFDEFARLNNLEIELNVPIMIGGDTVGALVIYRGAGSGFSADEIALAVTLSAQLSLAIRANRLSEEGRARAVESALAREREKVAQERASEFAKANEALRSSLARLAEERSQEALFDHILFSAASQTGAVSNALFLYDEDRNELFMHRFVSRGVFLDIQSDERMKLWRHPVPADVTNAWCDFLARGAAIVHSNVTDDPRVWPFAVDWHKSMGHQSIIAVPLYAGKRAYGFMGLCFNHEERIAQEKLELTEALANQAALALKIQELAETAKEAAVAREQEKAAEERAAELARANQSLKVTLDVLATEPEITRSLGHVLRIITEQINAPSSALWLAVEGTDKYFVHLIYHEGEVILPGADHPAASVWPRQRDLAWKHHIEQKRPVVYDVETSPHLKEPQRNFMMRIGMKTLVGIPLLLGKEAVGSFTVRFPERRLFTADQMELVQALAHQATLALQLTRLADQARNKARETAVLEERNRLAREIHDTIAQGLTGVISQLEVVEESLNVDAPQALVRIEKAKALAKTGLAEARRSVWALHPPELEGRTLAQALERLVKRTFVEDTPVCRFLVEGEAFAIPQQVELELYRIAHEAIRNVLKHSGAGKVFVRLQYNDGELRLRVADDGRGIINDLNSSIRSGFGLISMRERTERIAGSLSISSAVGEGTTIEVYVPRQEIKRK